MSAVRGFVSSAQGKETWRALHGCDSPCIWASGIACVFCARAKAIVCRTYFFCSIHQLLWSRISHAIFCTHPTYSRLFWAQSAFRNALAEVVQGRPAEDLQKPSKHCNVSISEFRCAASCSSCQSRHQHSEVRKRGLMKAQPRARASGCRSRPCPLPSWPQVVNSIAGNEASSWNWIAEFEARSLVRGFGSRDSSEKQGLQTELESSIRGAMLTRIIMDSQPDLV